MEGAAEARLIVAASEADANLYYATGFLAPDPFVFLWHAEEKLLLMSDLERDRAKGQARVNAVLSLTEYEERARRSGIERPKLSDSIVEWLRERGVSRVTVPANFPLEHADKLRARGIGVAAKPQPFFEERLTKRPDEVRAIEHALARTEAALERAIGMIREASIRDGRLWSGGEVLTSEGVKRLLASSLLEDGLLAQHTIVACGEDACDPHREGSGPLLPNQPIILDVFPRDSTSQYFADITRTVVKGRASERLRPMYEAVEKSQARALALIRAGAEGDAIHREVQQVMENRGFTTGQVNGRLQGFFHGTGHGLGLEIHELPRISKQPATLRAGNVVTVEPGLYYPQVGGVRLEDVVVVTETGCRNLTHFPKDLEV